MDANLTAAAARLREAMEAVRKSREFVIEQYEKNGPQWTSEMNNEYYDASYVIDDAHEVIATVDAALAAGETTTTDTPNSDTADADKWRALVNCGRLRVIGTGSWGTPHAHIGIEMWATFPDRQAVAHEHAAAVAKLEEFAALNQRSHLEHEAAGKVAAT